MTPDQIQDFLKRAKDDPSLLEVEKDEIDELLYGVIKIEKKHLYGLDSTSARRRREEIVAFLDKKLVPGRDDDNAA